MEEKQRVNELPWDRPKPDPDDVDMFADRLTLAQIEAAPILGQIGQEAPRGVVSGTPSPETPDDAR